MSRKKYWVVFEEKADGSTPPMLEDGSENLWEESSHRFYSKAKAVEVAKEVSRKNDGKAFCVAEVVSIAQAKDVYVEDV